MPRPLFALLLVVTVVLVSGCGGRSSPSVAELGQSIGATRDRVDSALARITRAQSKNELLDRMDEAAATIGDAASDLDGVGAPQDYEGDVERLVESLHQLAFDVQATADQIRQPGFGELLTGTRGLSFESWDKVNLALARLSRRGIDVPPLQRH